jgi:hypothetical protein
MAYLRNEKENLEVSYPLNNIWAAIPKTTKILEWTIEEQDDTTHKVKIKTKGGFLAYNSTIYVEASFVDEKIGRAHV